MSARVCRCMLGSRRSCVRMQSGSKESQDLTCSEALAPCASRKLLHCSLSARIHVLHPEQARHR